KSVTSVAGNMVMGGMAKVGRIAGGWAGNRLANSERFKNMASNTDKGFGAYARRMAGRTALLAGDKARRGNWDVRSGVTKIPGAAKALSASGVDLGTPNKTNYQAKV